MKCPKCGGNNVKRHGKWGSMTYICMFCDYVWHREKGKPTYYYERDAVENKVGLIEEMKDHL